MGNYYTSRGVRVWSILAQVILAQVAHVIFAASRSVPYMAHLAHVVTENSGMWYDKVGKCDARVCTVCV